MGYLLEFGVSFGRSVVWSAGALAPEELTAGGTPQCLVDSVDTFCKHWIALVGGV